MGGVGCSMGYGYLSLFSWVGYKLLLVMARRKVEQRKFKVLVLKRKKEDIDMIG